MVLTMHTHTYTRHGINHAHTHVKVLTMHTHVMVLTMHTRTHTHVMVLTMHITSIACIFCQLAFVHYPVLVPHSAGLMSPGVPS